MGSVFSIRFRHTILRNQITYEIHGAGNMGMGRLDNIICIRESSIIVTKEDRVGLHESLQLMMVAFLVATTLAKREGIGRDIWTLDVNQITNFIRVSLPSSRRLAELTGT